MSDRERVSAAAASVRLLAPPKGVCVSASDVDVEELRRALWHDVKSVLAAASTNTEYVGSLRDLPPTANDVLREIEHELRLVSDVIDLVTARRDADRVVEVDARALVWLTRRSGGRIEVDVTGPTFPIRGPYALLLALTDALLGCVPEGATAQMRVGRELRIEGRDLVETPFASIDLAALGLSMQRTPASVVLVRAKQ